MYYAKDRSSQLRKKVKLCGPPSSITYCTSFSRLSVWTIAAHRWLMCREPCSGRCNQRRCSTVFSDHVTPFLRELCRLKVPVSFMCSGWPPPSWHCSTVYLAETLHLTSHVESRHRLRSGVTVDSYSLTIVTPINFWADQAKIWQGGADQISPWSVRTVEDKP